VYAYILATPQFHEQLGCAEFEAFTGATASGRLSFAPAAFDISRAAFISTCIHVQAEGTSLDELCGNVRHKRLAWSGFRIEGFCPSENLKFSSLDPIIAVANAITGRPNLSAPTVRLGLIATPRYWGLGPIVSDYSSDWPAHEQRPHFFSGSLPTRFARAVVNLVASPGDSLIDPCCGIGVVLIEALALGVEAVGCDLNPKVAGRATENLRALGLPQRVFVADARQLSGSYDAAALDLPYGRNVAVTEGLYGDLLRSLSNMASRLVVIAGQDLSAQLSEDIGLMVTRHIEVPKTTLVRHVHIATASQNMPKTEGGRHGS
jgi:tRNA (guanine10-N2)-dimethyltransferase